MIMSLILSMMMVRIRLKFKSRCLILNEEETFLVKRYLAGHFSLPAA